MNGMNPRNETNIEELNQWWDALPPASRQNRFTHWRVADPRTDIFMSPPINDYPGNVRPIGEGLRKAATWDDMMRMPEPYKTAFMKLRVLMPADDTIEIDSLGHVDADQWVTIPVDELDLDSDNML